MNLKKIYCIMLLIAFILLFGVFLNKERRNKIKRTESLVERVERLENYLLKK